MTFGTLGLIALSASLTLAGCATQPIGRPAGNELSSKAAGYYKYRLSLQRESMLYTEYGYLRIDAQDGKDRLSLCKDLNLGTVSFVPEYEYVAAGEKSDLGEIRSYRTLLPRSSRTVLSDQDDAWSGMLQIDTRTSKDGVVSLFVITGKANRYSARSPALPTTAKEFDTSCAPATDPARR